MVPTTTPSLEELEQSGTGSERADARARIVIEPTKGLRSLGLHELWAHRELLYFIAWRDVKVRYKQTAFGASWAVIQPVLLMVVFSLFLGKFLKSPDKDIPYPIFTFSALVPWTLFAQSLNGSATSLVMSSNLVSKVYFPRLILPIAAAGSFLLDFLIALCVLGVLMAFYGVAPGTAILLLPVFTVFAVLTALAIGVWLAALNVRYRDVVYAIPFLVQIWLFATPVAYPATVVHGFAKVVYGLNPMVGVVEGFRWALTGGPAPNLGLMIASVSATTVIAIGGLLYFKKTERTFADVI